MLNYLVIWAVETQIYTSVKLLKENVIVIGAVQTLSIQPWKKESGSLS